MPGAVAGEELEVIIDAGGTGSGDTGGGSKGGAGGGGGDRPNGGGSDPTSSPSNVTGVFVAIISISMLFVTLAGAYLARMELSKNWTSLVLPKILWLNTAILIASSATLRRSRRDQEATDLAGFRHWWAVTTFLGVLFLSGQVIAWRQLLNAGVYLATNPSSSFFYVFTAMHGLHLLGGIIALCLIAIRPAKWVSRLDATQAISLYWHFMDGLWVFLFLLLYVGH